MFIIHTHHREDEIRWTIEIGRRCTATGLIGGVEAFILGYTVLVILSAKGVKPVYSIGVMALIFAALALTPRQTVDLTLNTISWQNGRALLLLALSLFTAALLRNIGILDRLLRGASVTGCRPGGLVLPALVGLLPMPGGALVSAIVVRDRYLNDLKLPRHIAVYLNYWFRHIFVPSWPLFQAMIITAAVLGVLETDIAAVTWPATIMAVVAGAIMAWILLRGRSCGSADAKGNIKDLLLGIWPFLYIAGLIILTKIDMVLALISLIIIVEFIYRPGRDKVIEAAKFALRPTILGVLVVALIFKELITGSSAPQEILDLSASYGLPPVAIAYIVPFVSGLAAGGENFFAATAMPLISSMLLLPNGGINAPMLLAAYTGGYMGVMMSPVHLCLALTVEYFEASMAKSLLLTAITVILTTLFIVPLVWTG